MRLGRNNGSFITQRASYEEIIGAVRAESPWRPNAAPPPP